MDKCSCPPSQYFYNASAYGFAAEFDRPNRHSIPSQAPSVLGTDGGRGSARLRDFKFDGLLSVEDAHTEVGGSYDSCHDIHTTYAYSSLEGVNVADVLTADRVVSRLYIYSSADEISFSIMGSHFDNLKIAGYKVQVQWPTAEFEKYATYGKITEAHADKTIDPWLIGNGLTTLKADSAASLEETYHALKGMSGLAKGWKEEKRSDRGAYYLSPVNKLTLEGHVKFDDPDWAKAGIQCFGNIICIPKFGVIRLAELVVHKHSRSLTMFKVHMCSGHEGNMGGGGTAGSGGTTGP